MKIVTPAYYSDFKCIAGACTDTCCAGWDVDVDKEAYEKYKNIKGPVGDKLKRVMVEQPNGGCTFTLDKGRCPFLNDNNLCELIIAEGEDILCETCDSFPRFINEYGLTREIGLAPSCITAGEIIFNYQDKLTFNTMMNQEFITHYNDIDPELYFCLTKSRKYIYSILQDRSRSISKRVRRLIYFAEKLQNIIEDGRYEQTEGLIDSSINITDEEILMEYDNDFTALDMVVTLASYFQEFEGMEVINNDWYKCLNNVERFNALILKLQDKQINDILTEFDIYYNDYQYEYEQLLVYYVYRYFCDAVYDENIMLKIKIAVVGWLMLKLMDISVWYLNKKTLTKHQQIDMAHLYSRQFEHSYTNFIKYIDKFQNEATYDIKVLKALAKLL